MITMRQRLTEAVGWLLFLAVVASTVECICWNCMPPDMSDEEIDRILALDFKKRLMEKLGITSESEPELPENVVSPPKEVIEQLLPMQDNVLDNEEKKTLQMIVLQPLNNESTVSNTTSFFEYKVVTDKLNGYSVDHVTLWLHINIKTGLYRVYEKLSSLPRLIVTDESRNAPGWKKLNLNISRRWMKTPWKKIRIEIEGIETPIIHQPLLQLNIKRIKKRVIKRSVTTLSNTATTDCNPRQGHYCCKHERVISIKTVWPKFVAPPKFRVFTCSGVCPAHHRHTSKWTLLTSIAKPKRFPCCVPTGFQPMDVLLKGKDGALYKETISDLMVSSCGCS